MTFGYRRPHIGIDACIDYLGLFIDNLVAPASAFGLAVTMLRGSLALGPSPFGFRAVALLLRKTLGLGLPRLHGAPLHSAGAQCNIYGLYNTNTYIYSLKFVKK